VVLNVNIHFQVVFNILVHVSVGNRGLEVDGWIYSLTAPLFTGPTHLPSSHVDSIPSNHLQPSALTSIANT